MNDQAVLLQKWSPYGRINLAKYQTGHSYNFWTIPIMIFSPVANLIPHPLFSIWSHCQINKPDYRMTQFFNKMRKRNCLFFNQKTTFTRDNFLDQSFWFITPREWTEPRQTIVRPQTDNRYRLDKYACRNSFIQVNLFQKPSFLHQLTHNMKRDCSLNYKKNVQNTLCTKIIFVFHVT